MSSCPWPDRVRRAATPRHLYHATTDRRLQRYATTGEILPPVRGFDTREAAEAWGRTCHRQVIVVVEVVGDVWPLPDHHQPEGLAWWTLDGTRWCVSPGHDRLPTR